MAKDTKAQTQKQKPVTELEHDETVNDIATILSTLETTPVSRRKSLLAELDQRVEQERCELRIVCQTGVSARDALTHLDRGHEAVRRGDIAAAKESDRLAALHLRLVGNPPHARLEAVAGAIRVIADPSLLVSKPAPTPLEKLRAKSESVRFAVNGVVGFSARSHGMRNAIECVRRSLDRLHAYDGAGALQLLERAEVSLAQCEDGDVLRQVIALIGDVRAMVRDDDSGRAAE